MQFSKFDLERSISDIGGKISKFRFLQFSRMVLKNISVQLQHSPIKIVRGVCWNFKFDEKTVTTFVTLTLTL